ncbi:hypothetical protein CBP36_21225 (plasmid) [Acidovorax carolinensis]|uniref:Uncharacterized protein n=1 Tax=Acidovorax carolinensis TaxID=553814 RepID=A0A240UJ22_9BURK|nr:hypothetical protein [Acidovorax carolinensis]ART61491.1 hypothetical protein CBP36_21225 [Acidovorax carolinensis]
MTLVSSMEALKKQPLTPEEINMLQEFQRQFDLDDDDPLNVVLAMMARSQIIIETAPDLLQQKVAETIELHRTNLRDQAVLTAKEVISDISRVLLDQHKRDASSSSAIWRQRLYGFGSGVVCTLVSIGSAFAMMKWL